MQKFYTRGTHYSYLKMPFKVCSIKFLSHFEKKDWKNVINVQETQNNNNNNNNNN